LAEQIGKCQTSLQSRKSLTIRGCNSPESATYEDDLDEVKPETPSYREWDDMDNFWNQEGAFEEMSALYHLDEDG